MNKRLLGLLLLGAVAGCDVLSPWSQQAKLDKLYAQLQRHWQVSRDYLQAAPERMKRPE